MHENTSYCFRKRDKRHVFTESGLSTGDGFMLLFLSPSAQQQRKGQIMVARLELINS